MAFALTITLTVNALKNTNFKSLRIMSTKLWLKFLVTWKQLLELSDEISTQNTFRSLYQPKKKYWVEPANGERKEDQNELEGARSQLTQTLT